jgi:tetratricopeptide (TPR) repeat protein
MWQTAAAMALLGAISICGEQADLAQKSQRAKEALAGGRASEAIQLYRELIKELPGNTGLVMNLGLALYSAEEYRKAIEQFQLVLNKNPRVTPAWLMLGLAHLKLGNPAQAVEPLQRVLTTDPENQVARLELADTYLTLGRPREAAGEFRKLTELAPGHAKAWQGLGLSYAAAARRSFADLEKIAPESSYRYALAARSRAEERRDQTAFRLYRGAETRLPKLRGIHIAIAEIYRRTGHDDWAAVEERRERALPPPDCTKRSFECLFLAGRYDELLIASAAQNSAESSYWSAKAYGELALAAFQRLLEIPVSEETYELQAEAYHLQGEHHEAAEAWRSALKLVPAGSADAHRLNKSLARSLWLAREFEAAKALLEDLVAREPNSPELNYELGDTLVELRDAENAIPLLQKSAHEGKSLPVDASIARAYARSGNPAKAIPHFEAALTRYEDASILYQLARAYAAVGRTAMAERTMQRYRELSPSNPDRKDDNTTEYQQITPP